MAEGFSVWFDRAIRAGTAWEHELRAVLANAKAVLVVWSQHSVASRWVRREATIARRTRRLVPVRIDTSELPEGFRSIETALLDGWDGGEDHAELQPLLAGIARLAPPSRIDTVRPGYDSAFLDVEVPLPGVVGVADELRYLHFSVVLNPARRLAWYSAANIARRETAVERPVRWLPDPMVPTAFQPLDEHYRGTGFDRGHLTRSLAVAWGEERMATIARRQAFFFTNTAPQHPDVNQRSWLSVEEWEDALLTIHDRMVSFSGPALFEDDPIHRSVEQMIGRVRVRANFRLPRVLEGDHGPRRSRAGPHGRDVGGPGVAGRRTETTTGGRLDVPPNGPVAGGDPAARLRGRPALRGASGRVTLARGTESPRRR